MERVTNDPVKLREYADGLVSHSAFWYETLNRLENGLASLGEHWVDEQFYDFCDQLSLVMTELEAYAEETHKTVAALRNDAEALEKIRSIK